MTLLREIKRERRDDVGINHTIIDVLLTRPRAMY
jgi:hypothetical protein